MKYRLTCPACGVVVESPFVRVGAAVRCAGCQKLYRVGASMVSKQAAVPPGAAPKPTPAPPKDQLVIKNPEPPPRPSVANPGGTPGGSPGAGDSAMGASGIIGLSGLSEMMRQAEASGPVPLDPGKTPQGRVKLPPGQSIVPTPASQRASADPAEQDAHRRHRRLLFVLLAAMALLVGLLGIAIAITASRSDPSTLETTPAAGSGQVSGTGVGE